MEKRIGMQVSMGRLLNEKSGGVYAYAGEVVSLCDPAIKDNASLGADCHQVEAEVSQFKHMRALAAAKAHMDAQTDLRSPAALAAHKAWKAAEAHAALIEKAESEAMHARAKLAAAAEVEAEAESNAAELALDAQENAILADMTAAHE